MHLFDYLFPKHEVTHTEVDHESADELRIAPEHQLIPGHAGIQEHTLLDVGNFDGQ